jgi:hypothetical protein
MAKRARRVVAAVPSAGMPGFIRPQLATLKAKAPSGDQWLHEIKFDGYRVQIHLDWDPARNGAGNQSASIHLSFRLSEVSPEFAELGVDESRKRRDRDTPARKNFQVTQVW